MPLFVVYQTYRDQDGVREHHAEHAAWIERHAATGTFLLAGPSVPPGGSVILAEAPSEAELTQIMRDDAFAHGGVIIDQRIVEFAPRRGALRAAPANPLFAGDAGPSSMEMRT